MLQDRPDGDGILLCGTTLPLLLTSVRASAQELEPRAYSTFRSGSTSWSPASATSKAGSRPIRRGRSRTPSFVRGPVLAYSRALDVAGKSAKVEVVVPYGVLSGSADVAGQPRDREVSGFWDPRLRFSVNFFGAPALAVQEFASYRQNWIVGDEPAARRAARPVRHRARGQPGHSPLVDQAGDRGLESGRPVDLRARGGCTFYTDNDEYLENQTREQEPIYSVQAHVVHNFASRIWVGVNGTYYEGGEAKIDGVRRDGRAAPASGHPLPALQCPKLDQALRRERDLSPHRHRLRRHRRRLAIPVGRSPEVMPICAGRDTDACDLRRA